LKEDWIYVKTCGERAVLKDGDEEYFRFKGPPPTPVSISIASPVESSSTVVVPSPVVVTSPVPITIPSKISVAPVMAAPLVKTPTPVSVSVITGTFIRHFYLL